MIKKSFNARDVDLTEFESSFTESIFWSCIKKSSKKWGKSMVFDALKLFYCYMSDNTPSLKKSVIAGALGYLINSYDILPDTMPIIGLEDDKAILSMALSDVSQYVNQEIESTAKQRLDTLF